MNQVPNHKSHLLAIYIISHFPLVFISPTSQKKSLFIRRLFRSPFPRQIYFFGCNFVCVVMMSQQNTKLCDFSNTNNNDFISTPIAPPATSAESCDINAALLNLVMKEKFSGNPNEDVASHLNTFVELCDMQKKEDVDNYIVKIILILVEGSCKNLVFIFATK